MDQSLQGHGDDLIWTNVRSSHCKHQRKDCSDIVTSLPSVLPFEVSLQLQEGSTDMSQLNYSRSSLLATQCCLRFEPSSRTTLIGEQPNPWDLLQPQDVMSRHRGAKRRRRYGLLGVISLLSPEYLLSVERWPVHEGPPDHYDRLSSLLDLSVSQSGGLMPLHSTSDFRPLSAHLRTPPLLFGRRPPQSNCPPCTVPAPDDGTRLDIHIHKGGISRVAPPELAPGL